MFSYGKRKPNGCQIKAKAAAGFLPSHHLRPTLRFAGILIRALRRHNNWALIKA